MPEVPPPESICGTWSRYYREMAEHAAGGSRAACWSRNGRSSFVRWHARTVAATARRSAPLKHIWFRAVDGLPDDEALHRCLLAYASDFHLLDTALRPHGRVASISPNLVIASIDHAMWFHRSVRVDDWLLYAADSPSASGARGFTRGSVFARDGRLVASAAQEGSDPDDRVASRTFPA